MAVDSGEVLDEALGLMRTDIRRISARVHGSTAELALEDGQKVAAYARVLAMIHRFQIVRLDKELRESSIEDLERRIANHPARDTLKGLDAS